MIGRNMDKQVVGFIFEAFGQAFELMRPNLSDYARFSRELSREVQVKKNDNVQYSFDVVIDGLVKTKLEEFGIEGRIFSEESGFFDLGEPKYRVVYDPFCNSSLASRTFHEAAVGISVFTFDYKFVTAAIMDYQTGIVAMVVDGKTRFYQIQTREEITLTPADIASLDEVWMVMTLENRQERENMDKITPLLKVPKRLLISSGHIYWLKLAIGVVDVYLDPFGGERLYEMFACIVAQKAGCVVTDKEGKEFDAVEYLKVFEKDQSYVYYPVAARNRALHGEVTRRIQVK